MWERTTIPQIWLLVVCWLMICHMLMFGGKGPAYLKQIRYDKQPLLERSDSASNELKKLAQINKHGSGSILSFRKIDEVESLQDGCHEREGWGFRGHPSQFSTLSSYLNWIRCYVLWKSKTFIKLGKKPSAEEYGHNNGLYEQERDQLRRTSTLIQKEAKRIAYARMQQECFPRTQKELETFGLVFKSSDLAVLQPGIGGDGLIRSYGRLSSMRDLPYDQSRPIIAHADHPLIKLRARFEHEKILRHSGGPTQLLAELNKTLWIPKGRLLCRETCRKCVECRRIQAKKREQSFSDLPEFRLPQSPENFAFQTCGIDAFGPFQVKVARTTRNTTGVVKRWVLIFTCARYRCVHFEVVHDASTDAFLSAFTRFLARRPRPKDGNNGSWIQFHRMSKSPSSFGAKY